MSSYRLELSKSSKKFLDKSDRNTRERIINVIHALTENPYSYPGIIKLTGYEDTYRVRIGKYRVIYQVVNNLLLIFIQNIDSRGDVYKQLWKYIYIFLCSLINSPTTCTIEFSSIADKNQTAINPTLSLKEPIP